MKRVDWTSDLRDDRRVVADGKCAYAGFRRLGRINLRAQCGKGLIVCFCYNKILALGSSSGLNLRHS